MKCPNCGFENADSAKFCGKCGYPLTSGGKEPPTPETSVVSAPTSASQPPTLTLPQTQPQLSTSTAQAIPSSSTHFGFETCPNCGYILPPEAFYCSVCGTALEKTTEKVEEGKVIPAGVEKSTLSDEVGKLITEREKLIEKRKKLRELFEKKEVDEELYLKLDSEYSQKLNSVVSELDSKKVAVDVRLEEVENIILQKKKEIEELRVRMKLGEVPQDEFLKKKEETEKLLNTLEKEKSVLEKSREIIKIS